MKIAYRWAVVLSLAGGICCSCQTSNAQKQGSGTDISAAVKDAKTRIKEVTVSQFKTWNESAQKPVLIDVREDDEWQAGHAAGAQHISRGTIQDKIDSAVPDKTARVVLYCRRGHRSALAADKLQKMGYTNVFSLAGGFEAYQSAGLPAAK